MDNNVPENDSLKFYHFLHPTLLGVIFCVLVVSSILSAFETVSPLFEKIMDGTTDDLQTLPLYVIDTYHWSSTGAGFVFLPLTIPSVLSIPITHFVRHFRPRVVVMIGFLLMAIPMASLRWTQANTRSHETVLVILLFVIGVCLAPVQAIIMGDVSNAVRKIEVRYGITDEKSSGQGRGYALCNVAFAAGQAVGPLVGGFIKHGLGWGAMTMALGILGVIASVTSFFSISASPPDSDKASGDEC